MNKPWTPEDSKTAFNQRDLGLSCAEIGKLMGRSKDSIQKLLMRKGSPKVEVVAAPLSEREEYWKKEAARLEKQLASGKHEHTATDILVERAVELAPVSYTPPVPVIREIGKSSGSPQSAVLMLSDTHIGQVTHPDQTLGFGGYNFELFLRRLARLERSIFSILQDHTTTNIPEIVVALLGDMIHGNLNHAAEAAQPNTLFSQFYCAGHAIAQFLNNLSALAPIRVKTVVGNHPRWGTQKKMPTENRFSNLDCFLYSYIQALVRDNPRIDMTLDKQPFSLFDIQGWGFYAGHGDHLRGGDKMLGIPNHAVGRNISMTTQLFQKAGWFLGLFFD